MDIKNQSTDKPRAHLGVFSLAMINCAAVINLRNLPSMAEYGLGMVAFYIFSVIFFLIPTALVSAELATGFPEEGGIANWVSKAMGGLWGFLAVWLQLFSNVVGFPASLAYFASIIAYATGYPSLAENNYYIFFVILAVTWGGTWIALRGIRLASFVTNMGSVFGTIIPGIIITALGIAWLATGHESHTKLSFSALSPVLDSPEKFVFLLNVFLGFAGLEMSAAHAHDVNNPQRDYPHAILLSALLIFVISLLGSLAIAVSVPKEILTLESGVIQAIEALCMQFGIPWLIKWITWLMALGVLGWFIAWVAGPARGMLATAKTGNLPPPLQKMNAQGMPSAIIIWQAITITLFSFIFLVIPSVTKCFWILVAITAQTMLIMYILMFAAGIILKFKYPDVKRTYTVPFGNFGMIVMGVTASIICAICYIIGFLPPEEIHFESKTTYILLMIAGNIMVMLPPFIIDYFRKPSWKNNTL
ncbi:MAG: amino acid permease [Puniceicoccales bacterium]|jgi:amino acid transporter|nr:amino acid permease [Puniceicoccales bacterium]